MLDTPLRIAAVLAGFAALLLGMLAVLDWGIHSRHWSPRYLAMISLTVSNLALATYALSLVWKRRRNRNTHA